jgi:hypothetical protein
MIGLNHNYSFRKVQFEELDRQNPITTPFSRYKKVALVSYDGRTTYSTWYAPNFPVDPTDLTREITAGQENRIDLISLDNYKTTDLLWWVITSANRVQDPFAEIVPGKSLRLPNLQKTLQLLTS